MNDNLEVVVEGGKVVADVVTLAASVGALTSPVIGPVLGLAAVVIGGGVGAFRIGEKAAALHDRYAHREHATAHAPAEAARRNNRFGMFAHPSQAAIGKCADKVLDGAPATGNAIREKH